MRMKWMKMVIASLVVACACFAFGGVWTNDHVEYITVGWDPVPGASYYQIGRLYDNDEVREWLLNDQQNLNSGTRLSRTFYNYKWVGMAVFDGPGSYLPLGTVRFAVYAYFPDGSRALMGRVSGTAYDDHRHGIGGETKEIYKFSTFITSPNEVYAGESGDCSAWLQYENDPEAMIYNDVVVRNDNPENPLWWVSGDGANYVTLSRNPHNWATVITVKRDLPSEMDVIVHLTDVGWRRVTLKPLGPYTETRDGVEWTYRYNAGRGTSEVVAIPKSTAGAIVIPSSLGGCPVVKIGEKAFGNCNGLTSISIPSCVTCIGAFAFDGCNSLKSVMIPSSVTSIDESAFQSCRGLTSLTVPACVVSESSIWKMFNFSYYNISEVIITGDVTSIAAGVFSGCHSLTSLTIPNGVTNIGSMACLDCKCLSSVAIPPTVTCIEDMAFADCTRLQEVRISDLSAWCRISFEGWYSCPLGDLRSDDDGSDESVPGAALILNGEVVRDLVIPADIEEIKECAFLGCRRLESVTIPTSVKSIGAHAFTLCELTSVSIPSSVMSIGYAAFAGCSRLTSVTIPTGVTSIGDSAFYRCYGLKTVTIPSSVTSIANGAFSGCSGLTAVMIQDGVRSIGKTAFYGCNCLTSVTIPSSVTSIGEGAFECCSGMTSVTIQTGVTSIGDSAFERCYGLKSVTIPSSVTSIGYRSFYDCDGLTSVTILEGVMSIGEKAFWGCDELSSITIPSSVASIGSEAFSSCDRLTSVSLHEGVTSIGDSAFRWSGLTSVTIPSSVMSIHASAFSGCSALMSVAILEGVVTIDRYAFNDCTALKSVSIPLSVSNIEYCAFLGCDNLDTIYVDKGDGERIKGLLERSVFDTSKVKFVEMGAGGVVDDLNGDGRADIVMTINWDGHSANGSTGAWLIQQGQTAQWGDLSQRNAGWDILGLGATAPGKATADVYLVSPDNVVGAWTTDASGKVSGWDTIDSFDAATTVGGLGDFNGDGQSDLLLVNDNGAVGCYFTSGAKTGWNYFQSLGSEWQICGIGDLNGDGRDDLVLLHDEGFAGSWLTQADGTMEWANLDTLQPGFAIVGCGDFNGDGTDDVLLRKGNYYGAWIVKDGNARGWMGLGDLGDVTVEQIADFDGDGCDDLRIRTAAGDLGAELVKGEDSLTWAYYGSVGAEWLTEPLGLK